MSRSHRWVGERLASAGAAGVRHQELNAWCIERVVGAVASGALQYVRTDDGDKPSNTLTDDGTPSAPTIEGSVGSAEPDGQWKAPCVIEQMVGNVGDVFIMHPWTVHSGTLNLCVLPRSRRVLCRVRCAAWALTLSVCMRLCCARYELCPRRDKPRLMLNGMVQLISAEHPGVPGITRG